MGCRINHAVKSEYRATLRNLMLGVIAPSKRLFRGVRVIADITCYKGRDGMDMCVLAWRGLTKLVTIENPKP